MCIRDRALTMLTDAFLVIMYDVLTHVVIREDDAVMVTRTRVTSDADQYRKHQYCSTNIQKHTYFIATTLLRPHTARTSDHATVFLSFHVHWAPSYRHTNSTVFVTTFTFSHRRSQHFLWRCTFLTKNRMTFF